MFSRRITLFLEDGSGRPYQMMMMGRQPTTVSQVVVMQMIVTGHCSSQALQKLHRTEATVLSQSLRRTKHRVRRSAWPGSPPNNLCLTTGKTGGMGKTDAWHRGIYLNITSHNATIYAPSENELNGRGRTETGNWEQGLGSYTISATFTHSENFSVCLDYLGHSHGAKCGIYPMQYPQRTHAHATADSRRDGF